MLAWSVSRDFVLLQDIQNVSSSARRQALTTRVSSTDPPAVPQVQPSLELTHAQILAITTLHSQLVRLRIKECETLQERDVRKLLDVATDLVLEDAEDIVPTALMAVRTTGAGCFS